MPKRMWYSYVKGCPYSLPSSLAFVQCLALRYLLFSNKVHSKGEQSKRKAKTS